jgi:cellulose synthase/poly-beta-1,6-N-acetylglucosamine synthase-like glycosyltransferase
MMAIEYIILGYFTFCVLYGFIFSLAGRISSRTIKTTNNTLNRIAVLIPAYKEDSVIVSVAAKALEQKYPANYYDVVVIADQLQHTTLNKLSQLPVKLVKVNFRNSTKTKSLNAALAELEHDYDIAVILDADNIMEKDFLQKVSNAFSAGHPVIQGKRIAKNMDSDYAILDALSEMINNHIYRKGHQVFSLSCSLMGSGMAFDYKLLKHTLLCMDAVGGFDRELEYRLVEKGYKAVYLENAVVYDEKVDGRQTFQNQRRRWISAQFVYLKKYFRKGFSYLLRGNLSYFNSTVLRNSVLPRVLVIGFVGILAICYSLFQEYLVVNAAVWWVLFTINLLAFALAVPVSFYTKRFFRALLALPEAFLVMTSLLFKLKGANQKFIHTPHKSVEVNTSLK